MCWCFAAAEAGRRPAPPLDFPGTARSVSGTMTVSPATPYDLGDLKTLMQALLMREHAAYLARPVGLAEAVSVTAQIVGSA